jgi:hypothetical protein
MSLSRPVMGLLSICMKSLYKYHNTKGHGTANLAPLVSLSALSQLSSDIMLTDVWKFQLSVYEHTNFKVASKTYDTAWSHLSLLNNTIIDFQENIYTEHV